MKKLVLWRRRSGAAAPARDALQAEATAAEVAHEHADLAARSAHDAQPADHEDTVPAAFYRGVG